VASLVVASLASPASVGIAMSSAMIVPLPHPTTNKDKPKNAPRMLRPGAKAEPHAAPRFPADFALRDVPH